MRFSIKKKLIYVATNYLLCEKSKTKNQSYLLRHIKLNGFCFKKIILKLAKKCIFVHLWDKLWSTKFNMNKTTAEAHRILVLV